MGVNAGMEIAPSDVVVVEKKSSARLIALAMVHVLKINKHAYYTHICHMSLGFALIIPEFSFIPLFPYILLAYLFLRYH